MRAASLLAAALLLSPGIYAQTPTPGTTDPWPSRPIRLLVTVPPGGAADFIARTLAPKLATALGQAVVVENRAGASGALAADAVAKAPPDGLTLLQSSITTHGIGPHLGTRLPYDPMRDLVTVSMLAQLPMIMVVNAELNARSLNEVLTAAKQRPGRLAFASSGNGGAPHMAGELLKLVAGVELLHIAYKGSGPAVTDLVGGQVQIMFDGAPSLLTHIQSGKLRAIATASPTRLALMPELPTFAELGFPGVDIALWYGLMAPAGTPEPVIARLNGEVNKALGDPEVIERFRARGTEPMPGPPAQARRFVGAEFERWGGVVKRAGVKAD